MRLMRVLIGILILALVLTSCTAIPEAAREAAPSFLSLLPRLEIDFDEDGQPSVLGFSVDTLAQLTGMDMDSMALTPEMIAWIQAYGVQNVELISSEDGVSVLVNGELLPQLNWDEETLANVGKATGLFDPGMANLLDFLLKIFQQGEIDLVLNFPVPEGVEPVPVRDEATEVPKIAPPDGEKTVNLGVGLDYDEDGKLWMGDISAEDLTQLTGIDFRFFQLTPESVQSFKDIGVDSVGVLVDGSGLFLNLNELQMPNVSWDTDTLNSLVDLMTVDGAIDEGSLELLLEALSYTGADLNLRLPE
ncbi:MAG: hypothetical protein U9R25_15660 [Chloroflexota bacterium]|nr:hypothetical protein [Chloroflexota bacterium]